MNAHPCVSRTGGCVPSCMCAGSTCACGHLFMWWCVPWCMPPDHAAVGVCACACTCVACVCTWVQVRVCLCMIYMCALSGWGQTLDSQTGTPCPSCRDQRAGPGSSSVCLGAQLVSPNPSLRLSFLPCTRRPHPPQGPSRGERRQRFCEPGPVRG